MVRAVVIDDLPRKQIKLIYTDKFDNCIQIKTFKSNPKDFNNVYHPRSQVDYREEFVTLQTKKKDEYYPFKKSDNIKFEFKNHLNGCTQELTSPNSSKTEKLIYAIREIENDRFTSCYSSEVVIDKNRKSIMYLVANYPWLDTKRVNLMEYRLRWIVDSKDNFLRWEKP